MPWGRRLVELLAAGSLLGGCIQLGEQQFTVYVQNDLEGAVIVRFEHFGDILVKAGVNGRAQSAFGRFDGTITVMDADCRVVHTLDVMTEVGSLWLRSDGTVRFVETEYDPDMAPLPHTDQCEGAAN
jgi:hypothetical protein